MAICTLCCTPANLNVPGAEAPDVLVCEAEAWQRRCGAVDCRTEMCCTQRRSSCFRYLQAHQSTRPHVLYSAAIINDGPNTSLSIDSSPQIRFGSYGRSEQRPETTGRNFPLASNRTRSPHSHQHIDMLQKDEEGASCPESGHVQQRDLSICHVPHGGGIRCQTYTASSVLFDTEVRAPAHAHC